MASGPQRLGLLHIMQGRIYTVFQKKTANVSMIRTLSVCHMRLHVDSERISRLCNCIGLFKECRLQYVTTCVRLNITIMLLFKIINHIAGLCTVNLHFATIRPPAEIS